MKRYIKTITCRNANEFLNTLSPHNEIWRGNEEKRWVYRGQSDNIYILTPKSLREGESLSFANPSQKAPLPGNEQINAEINLLYNFATLADEVGLHVPGFIEELRHIYAFGQFRIDIGSKWPHPKLLDLLALAQHHGVPTRLIDFSYNPFVAAYFAATQLIKDQKMNKNGLGAKMVVWGIDLSFIYKIWHPHHFGGNIGKGKIRVVHIQRATNLFLFRQQALFLYDQNEKDNFKKYDRHFSIDEIIKDAAAEIDRDKPEFKGLFPPIIKVMVKKSYAEEILSYLKRHSMTKPYLMPTYDNVVEELWKRSDG